MEAAAADGAAEAAADAGAADAAAEAAADGAAEAAPPVEAAAEAGATLASATLAGATLAGAEAFAGVFVGAMASPPHAARKAPTPSDAPSAPVYLRKDRRLSCLLVVHSLVHFRVPNPWPRGQGIPP